jgi:hypothetical protein
MNDLKNFSSGMPVVQQNRKKPNMLVGFLFLIFMTVFSLFMGISGMKSEPLSLDAAFNNGLKSGTCVSGVPAYGSPHANFEYTRSAGFIPIIKEYYYIIISDDGKYGILVRADKDFGKNFDSSGANISNVEIKGNVRAASREVRKYFSGMGDYLLQNEFYMDTLTEKVNTRWLILGIFNALFTVYFTVCVIKKTHLKPKQSALNLALTAFFLVGTMICLYLLLWLILPIF